jgi:hypothetical protein
MKTTTGKCTLCDKPCADFKTCEKCRICCCDACVDSGNCCKTKSRERAGQVLVKSAVNPYPEIAYTSESMSKTMATGALACQDAVNLGGVMHSFDRVISELQVWARLPGRGTGWVNCHPIVTMYMEKFAHLNGGTYDHPKSGAIYMLVSEAAQRTVITLEEELRDAFEGSGTALPFDTWLNDMAQNPNGTLQDAAKKLRADLGLS